MVTTEHMPKTYDKASTMVDSGDTCGQELRPHGVYIPLKLIPPLHAIAVIAARGSNAPASRNSIDFFFGGERLSSESGSP
jgi:hypothetical protein